jgi:large subunit ribosomal protein L24
MKLKTGDKVTVIAGADKGKSGKILKVLNDKVIVEGVHVVKKHIKPKNNGGTGEIQEIEAPIHRSNVKVESTKTEKTKKEKTAKKSK